MYSILVLGFGLYSALLDSRSVREEMFGCRTRSRNRGCSELHLHITPFERRRGPLHGLLWYFRLGRFLVPESLRLDVVSLHRRHPNDRGSLTQATNETNHKEGTTQSYSAGSSHPVWQKYGNALRLRRSDLGRGRSA